ncbi:hypothetical protein BOX15_Mlig010168g2, partial [Macrostomum lignano]
QPAASGYLVLNFFAPDTLINALQTFQYLALGHAKPGGQEIRCWQGDPAVKKFESACSKSTSLQAFFSERKDQRLLKKFHDQKPQKFERNQLLDALQHSGTA